MEDLRPADRVRDTCSEFETWILLILNAEFIKTSVDGNDISDQKQKLWGHAGLPEFNRGERKLSSHWLPLLQRHFSDGEDERLRSWTICQLWAPNLQNLQISEPRTATLQLAECVCASAKFPGCVSQFSDSVLQNQQQLHYKKQIVFCPLCLWCEASVSIVINAPHNSRFLS